MIIGEIVDIIKLFRGFLSEKREARRKYFENFILPVWEKLGRIHEGYKISLEKYGQLIENQVSTEEIIKIIGWDSLNSADLRKELAIAVNDLPEVNTSSFKILVSEFVRCVEKYLEVKEELEHVDYMKKISSYNEKKEK